MFVNCYNGYGLCLFAVRLKKGVKADILGRFIHKVNETIDFWKIMEEPEGAIVRY